MAGAVIVARAVLANGVTEILKKLVSVVINEITLVWDFNDKLKNLQNTLNMILAVMKDAEKRQQSEAAVRLWMQKLKAIAYDAEDVLDDYAYEVMRRKREKKDECKSTFSSKVRSTFSSSEPSIGVIRKLAHEIEKINENLNKITNSNLSLLKMDVGSSSSSDMNMMMKNRETNSHLVEGWKIVGRENDKSTIIKMLLEENSNNNQGGGKPVSVIPIVGMGGLGKTTMAQLVFNDEAVKRHFDIKLWICVSDPFDVDKLFKNIAKSLDENVSCEDVATKENIVGGFQNHLRGKKFLLVLDDVWNKNFRVWHELKTPLMVGAEGSKILVTTRSVKVAELVHDKFPYYELGILNNNDSWFLFKEIAFGSVVGAVESPKLVEIGEEMVKRCGGLPLALIFLGSLMQSKKEEEEWKIIQDTKIWHKSGENSTNEILPSLRLSYDNLPSHLKLCFSYCCLFPKGWIFSREMLFQLWMAEGFLIESLRENAMSMEEIGNEYLQSLLCNFFFHDVGIDNHGDIVTFKMHDLVHDLARSVVEDDECLIVESAHDIGLISETTRRLNLVNLDEDMVPNVLKALKKAKKLRTILVYEQIIGFDFGNAFNENKRLRVLDLSGSYFINSTSSIGGLKHLRYLAVHGVLFPKGIGRLSFLQTLIEFNVGDKKKNKNAGGIEELEGLNLLTGCLSINHLQNVTSATDACSANLKEKKNLQGLNLSWDRTDFEGQLRSHTIQDFQDYEGDAIINNNHEAVLERLPPHPNLRTLGISGFEGAKLPRWMEDSSCLPNLMELTLCGGRYKQLAGFGVLPSLRSLTLNGVKLKCISNEFYYSAAAVGGSSSSSSSSSSSAREGRDNRSSTASTEEEAAATTTVAFPSLKRLTVQAIYSLEEWVVPPPSTTTNCFPLLEEIFIYYCPRLSTITPTTIFPSLKVLDLAYTGERVAETLVTNNLNSLTHVKLYMISNLISLPRQGLMENNNTLLSLYICGCPQFEGFFPPNKDEVSSSSCSSSSSSLQSLTLDDCPVLCFYPNLRSLTSLRTLVIQYCNESRSLQDELGRLTSPSYPFPPFFLLEHLEYVKLLMNNEPEGLEWRKSSRHTPNMLSFKGRLINIGMRCWWFPCFLLGVRLWGRNRCKRMLICLYLWLAAVLCIGAPIYLLLQL